MSAADGRLRRFIAEHDAQLMVEPAAMVGDLQAQAGRIEDDPALIAATAVAVAARLLTAAGAVERETDAVDELLKSESPATPSLTKFVFALADLRPGTPADELRRLGSLAVNLLRMTIGDGSGPLDRLASLASLESVPAVVEHYARHAQTLVDAESGDAEDLSALVEMLEGTRDLDQLTSESVSVWAAGVGLPSVYLFILKARPLLVARGGDRAGRRVGTSMKLATDAMRPATEVLNPEPLDGAGAARRADQAALAREASPSVEAANTEGLSPLGMTAAPMYPSAADPAPGLPPTSAAPSPVAPAPAPAVSPMAGAVEGSPAGDAVPELLDGAGPARSIPADEPPRRRRRRSAEEAPRPRPIRRPSRLKAAPPDAPAAARAPNDATFVGELALAVEASDYAAAAAITRGRQCGERESLLWSALALAGRMRQPASVCDTALVELVVNEFKSVEVDALRPGERALMVAAGLHAAIGGGQAAGFLLDPKVVESLGSGKLDVLADALRPLPDSYGSLLILLAREDQGILEARNRLSALSAKAAVALEHKGFNFARAEQLWERWQDVRTTPERVGRMLEVVRDVKGATDADRIAAVCDLAGTPILADLSTSARARTLLLEDDQDLRGYGSEQIQGGPLKRLVALAREVHQICTQAIGLARRLSEAGGGRRSSEAYWGDERWQAPIVSAAREVRAVIDDLGAGLPARDRAAGSALRNAAETVATLLIDEVGSKEPEPPESWMATHGAYLRVGSLPLDDDLLPAAPGAMSEAVMTALRESDDRQAAFRLRLGRFEFDLAERTIDLAGWEGHDVADWKSQLDSERRSRRADLQADAERTQEEIERGWSLGCLPEEAWREMSARVNAVQSRVAGADPFDRPVAEHEELSLIIEALERCRERRLKDVTDIANGLGLDDPWRHDVFALIEWGDLASAEDLIARSRRRERYQQLGPPSAEDVWDPLDDLAAAEVLPLDGPDNRASLLQAVSGGTSVGDLDFSSLTELQRAAARRAADAWFELVDLQRPTDEPSRERAETLIHSVLLPSLGLEPERRSTASASRDKGFPLVRALAAKPLGSTRHPYFGSLARGAYDLRLGFGGDGLAAERIVDWSAPRRGERRPVVALLFARLPPADRSRYLALAREAHHGAPVALVDTASLLAILANGPDDLGSTLRVTAPFAGASPYTPDEVGYAPPEIFMGRVVEIDDILDPGPRGVGIVYGGRRLGKTALLKAAKEHAEVAAGGVCAVYIDLLASMGRGRDPSAIWEVLLNGLARKLVLERQPLRRRDPGGHVLETVQRWLADGPAERRLVLLLDECDDFLLQDSTRSFATVEMLQRLTTETEPGRVRIVFTGLQTVKRFDATANLRFARFGRTVGVGPLDRADAMRLVIEPLEEVGFRFRDRAAVYRLLTVTRCEPSLLQVCCDRLVVERTDQLTRTEPGRRPPYYVELDDVQDVLANVAGELRQRLDQTLTLDSRYRAIALVLARDARDDGMGLRTAEIRRNCVAAWSAAFTTRTDQFAFDALIDELQTLGVIAPVGDPADGRWGLSSPIWLNLFGSRQEVAESLENISELPLPMTFDATVHRQSLPGDRGGRRSALTLSQSDSIWRERQQVRILVGSRACFADRVVESLTASARSEHGEIVAMPEAKTDLEEAFRLQLTRAGLTSSKLVVLPALDMEPADVVSLWSNARASIGLGSGNVRSVIIAFPSSELLALLDQRAELAGMLAIPLRRWNAAGLAHWAVEDQRLPLIDEPRQRKILEGTGGWPLLVEEVIRPGQKQVSVSTIDAGLDALATRLSEREHAGSFVDALGLPANLDGPLALVWNALAHWREPGGGQDSARAADLGDLVEQFGTQRQEADEIRYAYESLLALSLLEEDNRSRSLRDAYVSAEPIAAAAWRVVQSGRQVEA